MKISIITVCYNSDAWIKQSIESVVNQDYKDIEYIIIDGNSRDNTKEIVASYSDSVDKFVSEPDYGIYNAMNKGIKLASGDYIYFLGSDDYLIDKQVISDVVNYISKHPEYEFIYGNIEVRSDTTPSYIHKPSKPEKVLEALICGCLPHQASFAHTSLFDNEKIGLFSENYKSASDYEWFVKLAAYSVAHQKHLGHYDRVVDYVRAKSKPHPIGRKHLGYYDRVVASYNSSGVSSDIEAVLPEMFEIQNKLSIYQSEYWLKLRIKKYQSILINPQGHWNLERSKAKEENKEENSEEDKLLVYRNKIKAMESSKFWKLRNLWIHLKKQVLGNQCN